jgi:3-hydroxyisobutyrate dehydrogenase/2-hydroxy-3-oxopropionate reductase
MTTVGLLGTGRMGSAMSRALARGGYPPVLWNRTPEPAQALAAELGGRAVERPADVAAAADVCLTMLADDTAVAEVWSGPDGLLAGARSGMVLVDLSTVAPSSILRFAAAARTIGAGILDAPVSGSVGLAESGRLTLMVGGAADDLERARPVLEALADRIFHLGPLGSGQAMKLAVNAVVFGLNQALAEALVLAERAGIDREAAYDVLAASAVGAPYVHYKRSAFLDPDETPAAFAVELAAKDLRLISELAAAGGAPTPQADVNRAVLQSAIDSGRAADDFSSVAEHLRSIRRPRAGPIGATRGD